MRAIAFWRSDSFGAVRAVTVAGSTCASTFASAGSISGSSFADGVSAAAATFSGSGAGAGGGATAVTTFTGGASGWVGSTVVFLVSSSWKVSFGSARTSLIVCAWASSAESRSGALCPAWVPESFLPTTTPSTNTAPSTTIPPIRTDTTWRLSSESSSFSFIRWASRMRTTSPKSVALDRCCGL